jgi:hypothetical protein
MGPLQASHAVRSGAVRANGLAWEDTMINATEYRAMAAEHHRLAGMCRSPESREQHLRLEQELRALAEREDVLHGTRAPHQASDPQTVI